MQIIDLIWLPAVVDKLVRKHSVDPDEVAELFENEYNRPYFRFVEKGIREGENVYAALGRTEAGRYLISFFVYKTDRSALVISAREMTENERNQYAKQ